MYTTLMLNTFPELLSFILISPMILRAVIGVLIIIVGYKTLVSKKNEFHQMFKELGYPFAHVFTWFFGIVEVLTGGFLFIGFYTQIFALISIFVSLNLIYFEKQRPNLVPFSISTYILIGLISFTLLFSGAGFFAVDLPL